MYMSGNKFIIKQTPTTELLYINNVITQIYVIKRGITGNLVNYLKYFYTKYRKLKNTQYCVNVPVAKYSDITAIFMTK
jgi:hypothetical protein